MNIVKTSWVLAFILDSNSFEESNLGDFILLKGLQRRFEP